MPNYVSDGGVHYPAKEKVGLTNTSDKPYDNNGEEVAPGDPFIYEGPDRAAVKELAEASGLIADPNKKIEDLQVTFGTDFRKDPDFLQMTRTMGFNTPEKYLKSIGYDNEAEKKKFEERAAVIQKHELPKRHKEALILGGGKDGSIGGKQHVIGGWGNKRERSISELK